ncbi:glycoside hydrolase family 32 protein [Micromonospora sp. DT81.3]|uniref:glycoside hydrolase family 32 protein n=1 Tax=Actinomycetes TaxID=1760 RepID=UPI003CEF1115
MSAARMSRPVFHLSPRRHWMNDPNGLVYVDGVWHVFFQHNPEGIDWGNMSWGHATSTDLEHWREHPVALRHRDGEQIYSGSVVADRDGSLTAVYTSTYETGLQAQSRAVSRDGGYTWMMDPANPMLDRGSTDFRDPKLVRYTSADGHARWILVAVEAVERRVLIYTSDDLRQWEEAGSFGPIGEPAVVWECPDLVRLPLDGDDAGARWVLLLSTNPVGDNAHPAGSAMHYVVGDFDGHTFTADRDGLARADYGRDMYAGVTFNSAPGGEAVMLGWMSNWRYAHAVPSTPWRGAMSLPRSLSLRTIDGAPRLVQSPASFVEDRLATAASETSARSFALSGHSLLELRWEPSVTGVLGLRLQGDCDNFAEIVHDPDMGVLTVTRAGSAATALHPDFPSTSVAPLLRSGGGHLRVSLDGPLLEVFLGEGEVAVSNLVTLGIGPVTATVHTAAAHAVVQTIAVDVEDAEGGAASAAA